MKLFTTFFFCFLFITGVNAQLVTVSGTVTDTQNEPIPGASVLIKGTTKGTLTGSDGTYSLQTPSDATLVFSYVGMGDIEEAINGRRNIDANLSESANQIADVVVVGYGVQRRSDITGAVASVKMDDALKSMPVARITDALQGRLAGVSIIQGSGAPGSKADIRIRGIGSLTEGGGGPLIVIDGFIGGDLASLNPSDIQSIEVLKDASSTAIYGSRGANGVLLVTTRRASGGKPSVTYNGYVNFKTPATLPKQLSPMENVLLQNQMVKEFNSYIDTYYPGGQYSNAPTYSDAQIAELEKVGGIDYVKGVFTDFAIEHMHEVSVSGRANETSYLISGSLNYNDGIVRNSSSQRANYRVKVDSDIKKWLTVGVNLWGTYSSSKGPSFGQYQNVLQRALVFPRFLIVDNTPGLHTPSGYTDLSREPDPRRKVDNVNNDGYAYNSILQGYVEFKIIKGLTFRSMMGVTLNNTNSQSLRNSEAYESHPAFNNGILTTASASASNGLSWINTNTFSYIREFNKNHRVNATAVFEQSQVENFSLSGNAQNLFFEDIGYNNLALAKKTTVGTSRSMTTMMSLLARVNYVAFDRYMITASYRYDGSSLLAEGNQWFGFPSVALAWEAKKEAFLTDVSWLNQAKLRLGWGITGSQGGVPAYAAYTQVQYSVDDNGNLSTSTGRRANPNLRWENTMSYNIGLDFGFLSNRVTLAVDAYQKTSKDVILSVSLPASSGYGSELINAATILNQGIEATIGADPIATATVRWHTDITLGTNKGTLENIDGLRNRMFLGNTYENAAYLYQVGAKIGAMYGGVVEGLWKTTDPDLNLALYGPGSYKYKDLDGNNVINEKDQTIVGNGQPAFNWGWNNTVSFMNFDFSLFLIGVHGFDIYNNAKWRGVVDNRISPNPEYYDRWTPGNENGQYPGFGSGGTGRSPSSISSVNVEKGDFVKVKNITLGYTLPYDLSQRAGIKNLRFYVSLQNPFLFTSYSGLDPEVTLKNPLTPGADWGYYPNGRNYLLGVNFTF